jgi:hypothetical protein
MGVAGATRVSGDPDVKPGVETGCVGVVAGAPADSPVVPLGCHADGEDEADGGDG